MPGRQFVRDAYRFGFNGKEKDQETGWNDFGARMYSGSLGRWFSNDPLEAKYPSLSPYNFVANNPIIYVDPDGKDIVDAQGRRALTIDKKGNIHFTKYATSDIKRVVAALNSTAEGKVQLKNVDASEIHVKIKISTESKVKKMDDGTHYTFGNTIQGNYDAKDNFGRKVNPDGTYGIKEASITIYEGTIKEDAKSKNPKHKGLTTEQAIGAVAGHEIVHATDKVEIDKDIKSQMQGIDRDNEVKPNKVEKKIIQQSRKKR
jgi:RHS repeat-associated protein